jgi:hypothetical protein
MIVRSGSFGVQRKNSESNGGIMGEERFDFENLKVYQKALEYVDLVYEITKHFPKTESYL